MQNVRGRAPALLTAPEQRALQPPGLGQCPPAGPGASHRCGLLQAELGPPSHQAAGTLPRPGTRQGADAAR